MEMKLLFIFKPPHSEYNYTTEKNIIISVKMRLGIAPLQYW